MSRQQAQGIDQVSQAMTRMERVTQGAAATAEESAAVSEELNAQAETSLQVVADLAALATLRRRRPRQSCAAAENAGRVASAAQGCRGPSR